MPQKPLLQRDKVYADDYKFHLPKSLIAQYPDMEKDTCRLLVVEKRSGKIEHTRFNKISEYFEDGDILVVNNTRVFPAKFRTIKEETGDDIEVMLLRRLDTITWEVSVTPPRKVRIGNSLRFSNKLSCDIIDNTVSSGRVVQFSDSSEQMLDILEQLGRMPLPPYILREPEPADAERYQSYFAKENGSIAAPSALLHFTEPLVQLLANKGVVFGDVTLHLGNGHFEPITISEMSKFTMQSEHFRVPERTAEQINLTREKGHRVIAGSASVVRALESSQFDGYGIIPQDDWTDLFIFPPTTTNSIDGLISNFHLPQSKTMMLQSTLLSQKKLMEIYNEALKEGYKFGAFGDCMLIV